MRFGPGPVFVYETLLSTRRWQVYAVRSFYLMVLLIGLWLVWSSTMTTNPGMAVAGPSFKQMAALGVSFFYTITGIQLSVVLITAPAIAAGTICMDRARGTLLHMMVTDLSDAEIVLGKLGSRLIPVFCWLICGIPVTALAALLGGIDFHALFGAFLIAATLGVVGCSLALFISIWAKKTHEVIMAVFTVESLYLLTLPLWWSVSFWGKHPAPPEWFQKLNPYYLAFEPYAKPGATEATDYLIFVLAGLGFSAVLTLLTIRLLRRSVVKEAGKPGKASSRRPGLARKLLPSLPSPTLDGNPVLWREWHRSRPSRLTRILWGVLLGATWGLAIWGAAIIVQEGYQNGPNPLPFGLLFEVFFGFLFLSATAPTALSEERVRSSLDVLLSTPLSTRKIVVGKWWGAFRWVLILLPLPLFTTGFLAAVVPDLPSYVATMRSTVQYFPLRPVDRIAVAILSPADFLASGAMIVSMGLLIATWVPRLGRAVAISVIAFLALTIGWPILVSMIDSYMFRPNLLNNGYNWVDYQNHQWEVNAVCGLSPVFGPIEMIEDFLNVAGKPRTYLLQLQASVVAVKIALAVGLLYLTVWTFDNRLGRVSDSGRSFWENRQRKKGLRLASAQSVAETEKPDLCRSDLNS